MNTRFKFSHLALLLGGILWLGLASLAQAQTTSTTLGTFDNLPAVISSSATSNVVSTAVNVRQGRGIAILPYFAAAGASTDDIILNFEVSADGTNWTTTSAFSITNTFNGTTAVRGFHLLSAAQLDNVRQIRLQSIVNGYAGNAWVTNVTWSVGR